MERVGAGLSEYVRCVEIVRKDKVEIKVLVLNFYGKNPGNRNRNFTIKIDLKCGRFFGQSPMEKKF